MTDSLYQRLGATVLPAGQVEDEQLGSVLDPARDRLLGLFSAAITAELATVWAVARAGTALATRAVVADTYPESPRKSTLRQANVKLPALFLAREDGPAEHEEFTLQLESTKCRWGLAYVLGPLKPQDHRRLGDVLNAVVKVVQLTIRREGHPAYDGGAVQFVREKAGLASVKMTSSTQGVVELGEQGEGLEFYGVNMTLETVEIEGWDDDLYPPLEGVSASVGIVGPGGPLPDALELRTDTTYQDP